MNLKYYLMIFTDKRNNRARFPSELGAVSHNPIIKSYNQIEISSAVL